MRQKIFTGTASIRKGRWIEITTLLFESDNNVIHTTSKKHTFVSVIKLLVDILVHQGRLADTTVSENDHLQQHLCRSVVRW